MQQNKWFASDRPQETSRRLKNVLITIYWLGRQAFYDSFYDGPNLNLKSFEGLLGTALSKALEEGSSPRRSSVRDSGFGDSWYSDREELFQLRGGGRGGEGGGEGYSKEDSSDSLDSLGSRPHSISSDATLKGSSEGWCSDAEADPVCVTMTTNKDSLSYRRSLTTQPKPVAQFNQFLPSKDKPSGYVPAPLRKKRAERNEDNRRSWASPQYTEEDGTFTSQSAAGPSQTDSDPTWTYECGGSNSDSDSERPDPDLVLDDLASRRFHSPSPAPPTNFAMPISPVTGGRGSPTGPRVAGGPRGDPCDVQVQGVTGVSSGPSAPAPARADPRRPLSADSLFRDRYGDSDDEDEDDEEGYADPVQDDLYSRKVGLAGQPAGAAPYDKFLPKFWTPEEEVHIQKIKMGSQRRPWYRKMQGFSLHTPPHTSPPPPKIQLPNTECTPPVYARMDPTSGPKLVKCVRRPLLGRQDPREPPDLVDYEALAPDLSNDDMFSRRTQAFHSNPDMAMLKTQLSPSRTRRHLFSSQPELNIVTQAHVHRGCRLPATQETEPTYPDIEQDDVVFRRASLEQAQRRRPLSGAPDNYAPMPVPEPWALPPDLQARLLCPPCPLVHQKASQRQSRLAITNKADPVNDDMLVRKLGACSDGVARSLSVPSVPAACSEGDLRKWREIRESGQLRFKKRLMVERLAAMRM